MTVSGHKTRSVFDRYNIPSAAELRDAASKMEARNRYELTALAPEAVTVAKPRTLN